GATTAASLEPGEPATVDGRAGVQSAWYRWFPGGTGPATVSVEADQVEPSAPLVQVYSSAVADPAFTDLTPVGTHEPGQDDPIDAVHLTPDGGAAYYVQVLGDSESGQATSFDFTLTAQFDNDLFANATELDGDDGSLSGTADGATFPESGEPDPSG